MLGVGVARVNSPPFVDSASANTRPDSVTAEVDVGAPVKADDAYVASRAVPQPRLNVAATPWFTVPMPFTRSFAGVL